LSQNTLPHVDRKEAEKAIAGVEDFIKRYRDMDLEPTPQGQRMGITYRSGNRRNLLNDLMIAIAKYEDTKAEYPNLSDPMQLTAQFLSARACQILLDKAMIGNAFRPSEGMLRKHRECEEKVVQLQRELAIVSARYEGLRRLYGRTDEGSVES